MDWLFRNTAGSFTLRKNYQRDIYVQEDDPDNNHNKGLLEID